MSQVVSQVNDNEIEPMDAAKLRSAFDEYEKTKHIINVDAGDSDDEDDAELSEEAVELEEEDLPESEFMKEPADIVEYG